MEIKILDLIQNLHTPIGDVVMCFITKLGSAGAIWILLTLVLLAIPKTRKSGLIVMTALIFDLIFCNFLLKNLVARVRPCDVNTAVQLLVPRPQDYSFPSGHTGAAFTCVTALFLAGEKKLWKPALVLAVLIAYSRLYLYVHYPTDILGGILVGIACGYAGKWAAEYLWKMRTKSSGMKH